MSKGTCYESAYEALTTYFQDWTLVHGIVTGTGGSVKDKLFGHAWLEKDNLVLNTATLPQTVISKEVYYRVGKIKYTKRYSFSKALKSALQFGHYGPWDKKIWNVDDL